MSSTRTWRAHSAPARSPAWSSSTTRRAGTSGTESARAASPTTAMCRFPRTSTSATDTALPRTSGPRCARRGGPRVLGDLDGANAWLRSLPYVSRKVGIFGTCSGGRQAFLAGCRLKGLDAVIECWGGRVVQSKEELTPNQPVAPIDYTKELSCPIIGIFGNEDKSPTPEQVNAHEAELKKHGKQYEFHRYDGAGHGFFYYDRPAYRQEQAVDGWKKVLAFCEKTLR